VTERPAALGDRRIVLCPTGGIFVVMTPNDAGAGSFRKHCMDANQVNDALIHFSMARGPQTSGTYTDLPQRLEALIIDGPPKLGTPGKPLSKCAATGNINLGKSTSGGNSIVARPDIR